MQTKTLLFKRVIIRCSRIHEQDSSYRKCIVQCSLEYTIRGDVVAVVVATDVIALEYCKSFVEPVVVYVVEDFVESVVMYLVSVLVVSSCKDTCNVICNITLVDCAYCCEIIY